MFLVTSPWIIRKLSPPGLIWEIPQAKDGKDIFLTFDDGPHPEYTNFVLDELRNAQAKASFFAVGSRAQQHPEIIEKIRAERHLLGNHTNDHLNGWETGTEKYLQNILLAETDTGTRVFRPPYGRISRPQAGFLLAATPPWKIYMWTILSGDFDEKMSADKCLQNVLKNLKPGSIVVFHDSQKAWPRLQRVLPKVLEFCREKGFSLITLPS